MGVRDLWHSTLVYFGLAEDESYVDDEDMPTADQAEDSYAERRNVRRIESRRTRAGSWDEPETSGATAAPPETARSARSSRSPSPAPSRSSSDEPDVVRRHRLTEAARSTPSSSRSSSSARRRSRESREATDETSVMRPGREGRDGRDSRDSGRDHGRDAVTTAVKVHLIAPRSFNEAQQIADRFKASVPVILNLQDSNAELAKRLIDFGAGLTYALDGGMQRIADKVFLFTPHNVEVSAEDRARLVEQGFFGAT